MERSLEMQSVQIGTCRMRGLFEWEKWSWQRRLVTLGESKVASVAVAAPGNTELNTLRTGDADLRF